MATSCPLHPTSASGHRAARPTPWPRSACRRARGPSRRPPCPGPDRVAERRGAAALESRGRRGVLTAPRLEPRPRPGDPRLRNDHRRDQANHTAGSPRAATRATPRRRGQAPRRRSIGPAPRLALPDAGRGGHRPDDREEPPSRQAASGAGHGRRVAVRDRGGALRRGQAAGEAIRGLIERGLIDVALITPPGDQLVLEHLAGRVAGELVEEPDDPRDLVVRKPLGAEGAAARPRSRRRRP